MTQNNLIALEVDTEPYEVVDLGGTPVSDATPVVVGPPGKSAYQLAVAAGFEGTLEEWLESLSVGADVVVGPDLPITEVPPHTHDIDEINELNTVLETKADVGSFEPIPYEDMPSLKLIFENGLI